MESLMKMVRNYLKDRELMYHTNQGPKKIKITSGAAQGSILGPDLWNISYDEILKIEMPEDTFLVGYADDIAAVIEARHTDEAQRKLRQVMMRTKAWLDSKGLQLATHKTELLILTKKHIPVEIDVRIEDVIIPTSKSVSYLGIRLDSKLTFSNQIQYAINRAARTTSQLSRLMANIGGPLPNKRRLLMEASNSILLYGCEIWAETLQTKQRANAILSVQRTAALRVTSAYRTVSAAAVLVIAGMIPIDLHAQERMSIWKLKQSNSFETSSIQMVRRQTMEEWQTRWNSDKYGRWTWKLIPDIEKWMYRRKGEVNYYITQLLSGHGYFRKYLHKMQKCNTPYCLYENADIVDDAEHTFFKCARWHEERRRLEETVGAVTAETLVEKMTADEECWNAVEKYIENVLRRKKEDLDEAQN